MADLDAQGSELAKRIGGVPDLEPLKALVKTKAAEQSPATLSLRAMGEGGWHCQSDLFKLGLVESNVCQACFGFEGTFAHRCVGCPAREEDRKAYKDQKIIRIAQSAVRADDPLFKYGVPLKVPRAIKPKLQFRFIGNLDSGELFTGYIYTDGSMRKHGGVDDNRGGWAVVVVTAKGKVTFGMYGPNPHEFPTAFNAELLAVIMALRRGMPPMKIHTDSDTLVKGWLAGKDWTTRSDNTCADMWVEFWWLIEFLGPGIDIVWCKGHATDG